MKEKATYAKSFRISSKFDEKLLDGGLVNILATYFL